MRMRKELLEQASLHPAVPLLIDTDRIGGPCTPSRNGVHYASKDEADLYCLLKQRTHAVALAVTSCSGNSSGTDGHYAVYGADHKVRLLQHATGRLVVTLDERLSAFEKIYANAPFCLDALEYGKRAATERELAAESGVFGSSGGASSSTTTNKKDQQHQRLTLQFDPTGTYLLLPGLLGIKIVDWRRRRLLGVTGQADAGHLRFLTATLCAGDAVVHTQLQLARGAAVGSRAAQEEEDDATTVKVTDTLLVATAYQQRRLYVFSHVDPVVQADQQQRRRR